MFGTLNPVNASCLHQNDGDIKTLLLHIVVPIFSAVETLFVSNLLWLSAAVMVD
jgi:hypothetical protein